jgi:hypothetical protein
MAYYLIRVNGKYHDTVYRARPVTCDELIAEFQKQLKTENVKVRRLVARGE